MSPAKTAEPIVMSFGLWTGVGPSNNVLGRGPGPREPQGKGNFFGGQIPPHCKVEADSKGHNFKTAEPIEMPFGLRTGVGPSNNALGRGPDHRRGRGKFGGGGGIPISAFSKFAHATMRPFITLL